MDTFDPENDLIDQYLRGELHGAQLDSFKRKLEQDPQLKKDMEFRQMLVRGIQEHGAIQLKNYLRSRTTQKRVMRVSYKVWTYAAAAVALLLVGSTVVIWMGQQKNGTDIIGNTVAKDQKPEEKPMATEQPAKQAESPDPAIIAENGNGTKIQPLDGAGAADAEKLLPLEDNNKVGETVYTDAVMIASNIQVKPIRVESELDESAEMKGLPQQGKIVRNPTRKDATPASAKSQQMDSFQFDFNSIAKAESAQTEQDKFKLSFYNTKDAIPQLSLNKNTNTGTTEMMVYNLPYDNPIILNYENRYFLKAGAKYYEIDMKQTGKQNVSEVVDTQLLEALNK